MSSKALVIYHRVDYDGLGSALVVKTAIQNEGWKTSLLGFTYGDNLPDFNNILKQYKAIIMVDISFPPEVMLRIKREYSGYVAWIDHHKTAIQDSITYQYSDLPGLREEGHGAIWYAWKVFHGQTTNVPLLIDLLSHYDVWDKTVYDWDNVTFPIQSALRARYGLNIDAFEKDFLELISGDIQDLLREGQLISRYLDNVYKGWMSHAFPVTVDNKYRGICLISPQGGSSCFKSIAANFDIYVIVNRIDRGKYNISMYKDPNAIPEFSCGDYLKENYGGGGHPGAAGGTLGTEQLIRLIEDCEV